MNPFIQKLLLQHCKRQPSSKLLSLGHPSKSSLGFTLTELLVVVLTASLVVSSLMALVVQLMGTEQREAARTETQREMQLAVNYIASDLRQAVYIYDNSVHPHPDSNSQPSYLEYLPGRLQDGNNYRPVLAFWKTKPIENMESVMGNLTYRPTGNDGCQTLDSDAEVAECNGLWLRRQTYSFVAYFQVENYTDNDLGTPNADTNPNGKWRGKSRIVRYELDKYSDISVANGLERTPGYVDPSETSTEGFTAWPFNGSSDSSINCQVADCGVVGGAAGDPDAPQPPPPPPTLVDFVDFTAYLPANSRDDEPNGCNDLNADTTDPQNPTYIMMPEADNGHPKPAFFVCIRNTGSVATGNAPTVGEIQDVVVFLRGNAQGRSVSSDSFLPTLQTRITMRGVIDRVIR